MLWDCAVTVGLNNALEQVRGHMLLTHRTLICQFSLTSRLGLCSIKVSGSAGIAGGARASLSNDHPKQLGDVAFGCCTLPKDHTTSVTFKSQCSSGGWREWRNSMPKAASSACRQQQRTG